MGGINESRHATLQELVDMNGFLRKSVCDLCSSDITTCSHIRCMECKDMDLCIECFAAGEEFDEHTRGHAYTVIEKMDYPLFDPHWSAMEELQLIECIARFGYNNWVDVAEYLSKYRPRQMEECRSHYNDIYLRSSTAPCPDLSKMVLKSEIPRGTQCLYRGEPIEGFNPKATFEFIPVPVKPAIPGVPMPESGFGKHLHSGDQGKKSNQQTGGNTGTTTSSSTTGGAAGSGGSGSSSSSSGNVIGYLPLRGDFDVEWDNDAELVLADMEFVDDESPVECALKSRVCVVYNSKLDERMRRKQFVLSRGLLDPKQIHQKEKVRSKDEKDIMTALRPLNRFSKSENEMNELVASLVEERKLRERLRKCLEWKALGLTTLAQVSAYERERSIRAGVRSRYNSSSSTSNPQPVYAWGGPEGEGTICNGFRIGTTSTSSGKSGVRTLDSLAGWDLLSEAEQNVCGSLKLPPQHYLVIKRVVLKTAVALGHITKHGMHKLITLDTHRAHRLFDFFVSCNWIIEDPTPPPAK